MQLAPFFPVAYQILKPIFPSCLWAGRRDVKAIALTFDDGPHPQYTPKLLDVLDRYDVPASFFELGICVERSPFVTRQIYQQGHWLGLHGYDHRAFPRLSPDALKESLTRTQSAIATATGLNLSQIRDVRPPNGLFTPQTLNVLQQGNYRPVMWSVVPEDWVRPGVSLVVERVLQQVQNGSVIVLHDGYYGGQDVAATTAALIPQLQAQGYNFVTIDQFWR